MHAYPITRISKRINTMSNALMGHIICEIRRWAVQTTNSTDNVSIIVIRTFLYTYSFCTRGIMETKSISPVGAYVDTGTCCAVCKTCRANIHTYWSYVESECILTAAICAKGCQWVSCVKCWGCAS